MTLASKAHLYTALWEHLGEPKAHHFHRQYRAPGFTSFVPLVVDLPEDEDQQVLTSPVHPPEHPATTVHEDVEIQVVTAPVPVHAPAVPAMSAPDPILLLSVLHQAPHLRNWSAPLIIDLTDDDDMQVVTAPVSVPAPAPPTTSAPAPVPISLSAILRQAPHLRTGAVRVSTGKVTTSRGRAAKRAKAKPYGRPAVLVNADAHGVCGPVIDATHVPPVLDIDMFNANPNTLDLIVPDNEDINMSVLDPDQPDPAIDMLLAELRAMAPEQVVDAPAPPKPFSDEELALYLLLLIQQNGDQAAIPQVAVAQAPMLDFIGNFGIAPTALHV